MWQHWPRLYNLFLRPTSDVAVTPFLPILRCCQSKDRPSCVLRCNKQSSSAPFLVFWYLVQRFVNHTTEKRIHPLFFCCCCAASYRRWQATIHRGHVPLLCVRPPAAAKRVSLSRSGHRVCCTLCFCCCSCLRQLPKPPHVPVSSTAAAAAALLPFLHSVMCSTVFTRDSTLLYSEQKAGVRVCACSSASPPSRRIHTRSICHGRPLHE